MEAESKIENGNKRKRTEMKKEKQTEKAKKRRPTIKKKTAADIGIKRKVDNAQFLSSGTKTFQKMHSLLGDNFRFLSRKGYVFRRFSYLRIEAAHCLCVSERLEVTN